VLTAYTAPAVGAIPQQKILRVDGEWMLIADDTLAPSLAVVRGFNLGAQTSYAVAHGNLATAVYGIATDFLAPGLVFAGTSIQSYSASGPIAIPTVPSGVPITIFLNATSAAAMTLAAPAPEQDGVTLVITSNTAFAHTVTATGLFNDGSTTTNVATLAANAGASMTLEASRGKWNVISSTAVTFT
jgi:hypothetical protein